MLSREKLEAILAGVPRKPGCYLMKDGNGKVLYVGKAVNLLNRVRSYFHASASQHPKTAELAAKIRNETEVRGA